MWITLTLTLIQFQFLHILIFYKIFQLKPGWRKWSQWGYFANSDPPIPTGRRAYFCPNFPRRLRVYWATTALLSLLIITFLLGRHFLLGVPSQLTTSPEAIFPSTLGLDCGNVTLSFTAAANDEKVRFWTMPKNHIFSTNSGRWSVITNSWSLISTLLFIRYHIF
jgi:hypothetical protein